MSLNLRCLGALFLLLTVSTGVDSAAAGGATPALIFVVRRGWHIDIGFAASEMAEPLQSLAAEFPKVKYLLYGFGDRRYLLAKNRNAPVLLAAMWPGKGMILDTGLAASPTDAFGADNVIALSVRAGKPVLFSNSPLFRVSHLQHLGGGSAANRRRNGRCAHLEQSLSRSARWLGAVLANHRRTLIWRHDHHRFRWW